MAEFAGVDQHVGAIADVVERDHVAADMVMGSAEGPPVADDVEPVVAELLGYPLPGAVEIVGLKQDMS